MKKPFNLLLFFLVMGLSGQMLAQSPISKADRKKAIASLKSTQAALRKSVKGLSEQQLNFKANPDSWSIAECMEHIAVSEKAIFGLSQQTLKSEADPSLKSERKFSDEEIFAFIDDRSAKVKTRPNLVPKNSFGSYEGSRNEFKTLRKANIKYVRKTQHPLRDHFFDFPFGKADALQVLIFMSGHTSRHTKQIQEIRANEAFPAS